MAAGREKKGERATTSLEFEFQIQFSCGSPSTVLSDLYTTRNDPRLQMIPDSNDPQNQPKYDPKGSPIFSHTRPEKMPEEL